MRDGRNRARNCGTKQLRPCVFYVSPEDLAAELAGHTDLHAAEISPALAASMKMLKLFRTVGISMVLNQRTSCRETERLSTPVEGIRDAPAGYQFSTVRALRCKAGARYW